jgi:hypothetical protein
MVKKSRCITIRATQSDVDQLQSLTEASGKRESAVLRALIRASTVKQVRRGLEKAQ